ncbi:MAG: hypothetical protein RLZZ28_1853 [Bacteroidota bacterium]
MHWLPIAASAAEIVWQENNLCIVELNGKKITLGRFNGKIFAFAHKCPHASGIMADGYINALGQISCPLHRYRFDMKNGRNTSGEGYYLKTYPTEIREDGVYIGLEDRGFWGG